MIDEFLHTRPSSQRLDLIITTRSTSKGEDSVKRLHEHLQKTAQRLAKDGKNTAKQLQGRIRFRHETLDLCKLLTVKQLAAKLGKEQLKIDTVIMNAGIGGWSGINYPLAIYLVLTDLVYSVTYPALFKMGFVGLTAKPQVPGSGEPPLAEVFCANVFGHYMLGHWLVPLLAKSRHGRIVWLSSNEAYARALVLEDLQAFRSSEAYESGKRLTDVLAISSTLPGPRAMVNQYLSPRNDVISIPASEIRSKPRNYVCQPGVVATSIIDLPRLLVPIMIGLFLLARTLGSIYHCVDSYKGAVGPVWLALASQETLDSMERRYGVAKFSSAVDQWAEERVERVEVEGWGYGGKVEDAAIVKTRKGRMRGQEPVTEDELREFTELGTECWKQMEELRTDWETRIAQKA